jgi:hypothetical protein
VTEDAEPDGWVALSDAIAALRRDLAEAWWDGQNKHVRFKVEPVEMTTQVGVTKTGKGQAGVKWHILALGGEKSRETTATQTLRLRQLVSGQDEPPADLDERQD